jgi:hypothetical protein
MFKSSHPFVVDRIRAAAVTCSDGRWGAQIDDFIEIGLALPRYDRVAIPGGAGCLAGRLTTWKEEAAFEQQLALLVEVHGLTRVVLIAHQECAFYTVRLRVAGDELERRQREDLAIAADFVRRLHHGMQVESYFARRRGHLVEFEEWKSA